MLLESGGLQITPVFIQDAGNYTCYAANTEGSLKAAAALTVWSKCLWGSRLSHHLTSLSILGHLTLPTLSLACLSSTELRDFPRPINL